MTDALLTAVLRQPVAALVKKGVALERARQTFKRLYAEEAVRITGNKTRAARKISSHRSTIQRELNPAKRTREKLLVIKKGALRHPITAHFTPPWD